MKASLLCASTAPDQAGATETGSKRLAIFADLQPRARQLKDLLEQGVHGHFDIEYHDLTDAGIAKNQRPPEVALLDIQSHGFDLLYFIKQMKLKWPGIAIIVLTRDANASLARRALRAGASAYLTAEEAQALLPSAIETIAAGERFVSDNIMQGILHGMVETGRSENRLPIEMLSDREMVIFQMIGRGKSLREIADELNLNIKTVATHCGNIRRKLHSRDNRHLIRMSRDWVEEEQLQQP
ncbi:MAG: LuxR C-terminal-related transcriptional regulator [Kiritimatiellia bacterium]|jgi:DNA-binding NarL/FixJ family response regulator